MRHHPRGEVPSASSALLFGFRPFTERFFLRTPSNLRERSAIKRTRDACSAWSRRPAPAGGGLALRRSTAAFVRTLAPRLLPGPMAFTTLLLAGKDRALGAVVRREAPPRPPGITIANRDRRRRSPLTFGSPRNAPQANGDDCGLRASVIGVNRHARNAGKMRMADARPGMTTWANRADFHRRLPGSADLRRLLIADLG
jgi:hypothetical protein